MTETDSSTSQQAVREASLPEPWLSAYLEAKQAREHWATALQNSQTKAEERRAILLQLAEQDRNPVTTDETAQAPDGAVALRVPLL